MELQKSSTTTSFALHAGITLSILGHTLMTSFQHQLILPREVHKILTPLPMPAHAIIPPAMAINPWDGFHFRRARRDFIP